MNRLVLLVCLVSVEYPPTTKSSPNINIAYYELPPYIYKDDNGSMSGIFPELFAKLSNFCEINFRYSLDTMSPSNFSYFMENETLIEDKYKYGDWLWLPLTQNISKEKLASVGFFSSDIFTTGIDVVVHRDILGPFCKDSKRILSMSLLVLNRLYADNYIRNINLVY